MPASILFTGEESETGEAKIISPTERKVNEGTEDEKGLNFYLKDSSFFLKNFSFNASIGIKIYIHPFWSVFLESATWIRVYALRLIEAEIQFPVHIFSTSEDGWFYPCHPELFSFLKDLIN